LTHKIESTGINPRETIRERIANKRNAGKSADGTASRTEDRSIDGIDNIKREVIERFGKGLILETGPGSRHVRTKMPALGRANREERRGNHGEDVGRGKQCELRRPSERNSQKSEARLWKAG
jgi:hypothetical protein